MKFHLPIALRFTFCCIVLTMVLYPAAVRLLAFALAPGHGDGQLLKEKGRVVGFARVGQAFRDDRYFHGRPSAVNYNAAGSGASNLAPSNPDLLRAMLARRDSFLMHNPGILPGEIPVDLVTASGSGLDPDISVQAARIQVPRIARIRKIPADRVMALVIGQTHFPLAGLLGPETIDVLELNIALDELK